jgi:hypothetical protein
MYVWSGSAWVSVATEVESLAGFATQSYADNTPGVKLIVPSSVTVGSGSGSVATQGTVSFSGASSVSINGCFSSTYDHYEIKFQGVASTNISLLMRMRVSGADDSGNNYQANSIFATPASTTIGSATGNSSATSAIYPVFMTTGKHLTTIQMSNPFETSATPMTYHSWSGDGTSGFNLWGAGRHTGSTSYTGFSLITSSGTITGTVSVYGYKAG